MKEFYKILGVGENATDEEIAASYHQLKEKYSEERWLEGEAGNEAARMLTKVETAYKEIMACRKETKKNTEGQNSYEKISDLLKQDRVAEAQACLDEFNERSAEWHYLQAVVYYKKNWTNDSKKQLEIAMQMDPNNQKYRMAYGKLNARVNQQANPQADNPYARNAMPNDPYGGRQQMGGNACGDCISCCYTYLCIDCLFSICCGCN